MDFIIEGLLQAFGLLFRADPETYSAIWATIQVSGYAMAASLLLGIPAGFLLGHTSFTGKRQIQTIVDTLLALPTVFIGLMVYALLSHRGPLGEWGLLFSIPGIAIGQTILALPIVIALCAAAVDGVDEQLRITLMSLGAGKRQLLLSTLWEVRYGIIAAAVTASGRVLTEVGISMMVGGNIKWHTRTITTAIALETNKGQFANGIALGIVLIAMAFAVNIALSFFRRNI